MPADDAPGVDDWLTAYADDVNDKYRLLRREAIGLVDYITNGHQREASLY